MFALTVYLLSSLLLNQVKKLSPKPGCKNVVGKLEIKKARMKRSEIKMDSQGQCSVSVDENVILMITIQDINRQLKCFVA